MSKSMRRRKSSTRSPASSPSPSFALFRRSGEERSPVRSRTESRISNDELPENSKSFGADTRVPSLTCSVLSFDSQYFQDDPSSYVQQSFRHASSLISESTGWLKVPTDKPQAPPAPLKKEGSPVLFWRSQPVKLIVGNLVLAVFFRKAWILYGTLVVLFTLVASVATKWFGFYSQDPEVKAVGKLVRSLLRRFVAESEKATNGNYARQLVVGYALASCTGPGESYIGYIMRYKMMEINTRIVEDVDYLRGLG